MSKETKNQGIKLGTVASFLSQGATIDEETLEQPVVEETVEEDEDEVIDPSKTDLDDKEVEEVVEETEEEVTEEEDDTEEESTEEPIIPNDADDLSEYEPQLASYLEEKLYDKFGWTIEDEDKRAKSIDDIVALLQEAVTESSIPAYSNDEIAQIDEYVRNGGSLKTYFESKYVDGVDLDALDISREVDQERVLREWFKIQGLSDNKIEKRIQNYDSTGILQDEAEYAFDLLKTHKEKESKKLLEEQEKLRKETEKQQQKFVDSVISDIDSRKDVLGIPLTKAERDKLKANILKVGDDGMTEYQRLYNKSTAANLVETAFLITMKDKFMSRSTKSAVSKAAQELKQKIQAGKSNPRQKSAGYQDPKSPNLLRKAALSLK